MSAFCLLFVCFLFAFCLLFVCFLNLAIYLQVNNRCAVYCADYYSIFMLPPEPDMRATVSLPHYSPRGPYAGKYSPPCLPSHNFSVGRALGGTSGADTLRQTPPSPSSTQYGVYGVVVIGHNSCLFTARPSMIHPPPWRRPLSFRLDEPRADIPTPPAHKIMTNVT